MPSFEDRIHEKRFEHNLPEQSLPESFDLRELGFIGAVRNQGVCGSCWAFGAVASLESMAAKKYKMSLDLSEQEIVSCASEFGVMGCDGGNSMGAWSYSSKHPLVREKDYPYLSGKSGNTGRCKRLEQSKRTVSAGKGYQRIDEEQDIKAALVSKGAVAIAISADNSCFMGYKGGILGPECGCSGQIDHLVAVVGYGNEKGKEYWIVRNSWGESWGEKGYVRFEMGKDVCEMTSFATIPTDVLK